MAAPTSFSTISLRKLPTCILSTIIQGLVKKHFRIRACCKKTYVSILERREFAAINIKPKELRIGFDLGERAFDDTVTKSKLTGPMPRISHMLVLTDKTQLNNDLVELLKLSYQRCH